MASKTSSLRRTDNVREKEAGRSKKKGIAKEKEYVTITPESYNRRRKSLKCYVEKYPYLKMCDARLCDTPTQSTKGRAVVYLGQLDVGLCLPLKTFTSRLLSILKISPQQVGGVGWTVLYMCEMLREKGIHLTIQWFVSKFTLKHCIDRYGVSFVTFSHNQASWLYHPFGYIPQSVKGWWSTPITIDASKLCAVDPPTPVPTYITDFQASSDAYKHITDHYKVESMAEDVDELIAARFGGVPQVDWRHFLGTDKQKTGLASLDHHRAFIAPRPPRKKKKDPADAPADNDAPPLEPQDKPQVSDDPSYDPERQSGSSENSDDEDSSRFTSASSDADEEREMLPLPSTRTSGGVHPKSVSGGSHHSAGTRVTPSDGEGSGSRRPSLSPDSARRVAAKRPKGKCVSPVPPSPVDLDVPASPVDPDGPTSREEFDRMMMECIDRYAKDHNVDIDGTEVVGNNPLEEGANDAARSDGSGPGARRLSIAKGSRIYSHVADLSPSFRSGNLQDDLSRIGDGSSQGLQLLEQVNTFFKQVRRDSILATERLARDGSVHAQLEEARRSLDESEARREEAERLRAEAEAGRAAAEEQLVRERAAAEKERTAWKESDKKREGMMTLAYKMLGGSKSKGASSHSSRHPK